MSAAVWQQAQARARQPGSSVLNRWVASTPGAAERISGHQAHAPRADISLSQGSDSLYELFGATPPNSGAVAVNAISAQRVAAVSACVQRIASISTLPAHVYSRTSTGRQRIESPLWWLLNEQPSPSWTAASHWEWSVQSFLLRGDAFTRILRSNSGEIGEFQPLDWRNVIVAKQPSGRLIYAVLDVDAGERISGIDQDDMLHFPGFGFDGESGMSAIKYAARAAVGGALAMDEYSQRFFSGGAHPSLVLETDRKMDATQVNTLQTAFVNKYAGVQNAHAMPLVLTEGIKAREISLSAEDAQLLEARRYQVSDIARAFGVPPHMIGETTASTSWGSGIEQMGRAFITYTLQPHLVRIEQELNRKLFRTSGQFVEFHRDALLEGDSAAQAAYFRAAMGGPGTGQGWMTVNEVRRIKNMPPVDDGDTLFDPRTLAATAAPTQRATP